MKRLLVVLSPEQRDHRDPLIAGLDLAAEAAFTFLPERRSTASACGSSCSVCARIVSPQF